MRYKDYIARVEFDDEAGLFHGEVVNIRDVITFQGRSVDELRRELRESVEDYLAFCAKRGEEPEKPFSGKFVVRVSSEIHRQISLAATKEGVSLNAWVTEALRRSVSVEGVNEVWPLKATSVDPLAKQIGEFRVLLENFLETQQRQVAATGAIFFLPGMNPLPTIHDWHSATVRVVATGKRRLSYELPEVSTKLPILRSVS